MLKHGDNTLSARDPVTGSDCSDAATPVAIDMSIGPWLRERRIGLGLTIPVLARQLKLQGRYIEALEREDFASMPGQPYLGGYVRSIATALELNPREAMERLHTAQHQPRTRHSARPLNFPRPSLERRLPISAIISVSIAVSIGAYAYWYATKSADMGRPLLSPVADLEASSEPRLESEHLAPAPGPLQPLGVPALSESVDAANALGEGAVTRRSVQTARQQLPQGAVPRPRPGTPAAAIWAAQIEWPLPDKDQMPESVRIASAPVTEKATETQGLPASASLAAYLPSVRLRSDLGPLRGTVGLPHVVQVAQQKPVNFDASEPAQVARTQAFAAVPSSNAVMRPISGGDVRATRAKSAEPYDPLATLPPVNTDGATPSETILIIADEPCWIEIRSSTGRVIAQKLLQAGERFTVPQRSGLQLTAGNAGGIRVLVDGVTAASFGSSGQVVRGVSLNPYSLLAQR